MELSMRRLGSPESRIMVRMVKKSRLNHLWLRIKEDKYLNTEGMFSGATGFS